MKIQQLRYIVEIVNQNLNVTEAANALFYFSTGDQQTSPFIRR